MTFAFNIPPKIPPWSRWKELLHLLTSKTAPERSSWAYRYVEVAHGRATNNAIEQAYELILDRDTRDILTAYFFSRAGHSHISRVTEIQQDVLEHFRYLVSDVSVARNKLEHRRWAETYYEELAHTEVGASLVRGAILYGPDFLDNHIKLGIESPVLNIKDYAERMLQQAYHMAMLATGAQPTSELANSALKWYKAATSMLTAYSNLESSEDSKTEALVAIRRHREAKKPKELGINPADILN